MPALAHLASQIAAVVGVDEPLTQLHSALAQLTEELQPATYGEIGSRKGHSAAIVALCSARTAVRCFDFTGNGWGGEPGTAVALAACLARFAPGRHEMRLGDSQTAGVRAAVRARGPYDLFLIDGDHSVAGCEFDFETVLPAMAPGGVIVIDDLDHHPELGELFERLVEGYAGLIARAERRRELTCSERGAGLLQRGVGIIWLKAADGAPLLSDARRAAVVRMAENLAPGAPPVTFQLQTGPVTVRRDREGELHIEAGALASTGIEQASWGPPLWRRLHRGAWQAGTRGEREALLAEIARGIRCGECAEHWRALLAEVPPPLEDRTAFFEWTVHVHNAVSLRLEKPTMSVSTAELLYTPAGCQVMQQQDSPNLGDAIAHVVLASLVPTLASAVPRLDISSREPAQTMIVHGWLGHNRTDVRDRDALFAGVFVGHDHAENFRWARASRFRHVGARCVASLGALREQDCSARMIGDSTLCLPRYTGPRAGSIAIDAEVPGLVNESNALPHASWPEKWRAAVALIGRLATAEAVYTSRLHVALACYALGTPVWILPPQSFTHAEPQRRFTLLDALGADYARLHVPPRGVVESWARRYRTFLAENLRVSIPRLRHIGELRAEPLPTLPS